MSKKTDVLKLMYIFLHWMIYISIAHVLKSLSLKFLINLLDAQEAHLILLEQNLIAFSCFHKHMAIYLRL